MNKFFLLLVPSLCILTGCGGSREAAQKEIPAQTLNEFLSKYEKTFDPAAFDADLNLVQNEVREISKGIDPDSLLISSPAETTDGFRVQISSTQEIDQASNLRDSVSALLPDDRVYIVYDAPNYKVRIGNFLDRPSANKTLEQLLGKGYREAWIVPDRVLKNPPPKPPGPPHQPEENH